MKPAEIQTLYDRLASGEATAAQMATEQGCTRAHIHKTLQTHAEANGLPWPVIVLTGRYVHEPILLRRTAGGRILTLTVTDG